MPRCKARVDGEPDVQFGHTSQDERRQILVPALAARTVHLLIDPDLGGAFEQPLQADRGLGTGQRGARAAVHTPAERHMVAGIGPVDVESVGIGEFAGIPSSGCS